MFAKAVASHINSFWIRVDHGSNLFCCQTDAEKGGEALLILRKVGVKKGEFVDKPGVDLIDQYLCLRVLGIKLRYVGVDATQMPLLVGSREAVTLLYLRLDIG